VRSVIVVVAFELVQHGCGVLLVEDQEAVEEFTADCPDKALGDRIRPGCTNRRLDDPHVDGGEDRIEGGAELGVAVADEEQEAAVGVVEVHERVAGLLGEPGAGGVGSDAEDVHAAGGVLDDEDRVQPVHGDRVEVKQVAGQDRMCLRPQKRAPRRSGPSRRRVDAGGVQDSPDGGGSDLVAEPRELAVDASISPGGVLGGRRRIRVRRPAGMAGRPGRTGWVVQRRMISSWCQRRMVAGVVG